MSAHGVGGRMVNSPDYGQNLDNCHRRMDVCRRHQGLLRNAWLAKVLQRVRPPTSTIQVRRAVLGKVHVATTRLYKDQRFAPDNIVWGSTAREDQSLAGGMERVSRRYPQRSPPQRSPPGRHVAGGRHHGPRCPSTWAASSHMDEIMASKFEWVPGGNGQLQRKFATPGSPPTPTAIIPSPSPASGSRCEAGRRSRLSSLTKTEMSGWKA